MSHSTTVGLVVASIIFTLAILIMSMILGFGIDYQTDDIYNNLNWDEERRLEEVNLKSNIKTNIPSLDNPLNINKRNLDEPYDRNYYEFEVENKVIRGRQYNKAGFSCCLVDIVVRISEIYLLCCCFRYGCKPVLMFFVILSLCLTIAYLVLFSLSYHKFKDVDIKDWKDIEENIEPLWKDVKKSKKLLISIIVFFSINILLTLGTLISVLTTQVQPKSQEVQLQKKAKVENQ